jgi:hypothetical protein
MPGRKPYPTQPGTRVSLGLKVTPGVKTRLDETAKNNGRTQSQEAEVRLERSFEDEDALDRAMLLAYADIGPLLFLVGEVLRVAAPHGGGWLDDDASAKDVAAAFVHLLRRLRSPDDGVTASNGVEKRVDDLLFDMGYTGAEHRAPESPRARWALEKRRRFGIFAERLIRYRMAVMKELLTQPPHEMAKPKPEDAASWARAVANLKTEQKE